MTKLLNKTSSSFIGRLVCLGALLSSGAAVHAEEESWLGWMLDFDRQKGVQAVDNESWKEECGSCHFAYPPGLMVSQSWEKLLTPAALEDHFGENAELDESVLADLKAYALSHAAEKSYFKRSRKITRSVGEAEAPLRITDTDYIRRKHEEIPKKLIKGNPDVQLASNCTACHTKADKGIFDDDTVNIPGHGAWDD
jgi:hypothetical protein